ncbi:hypothetical protein [Deinococcus pimensis]|uniref:hypothetical protein n=1 Tax=Deinococcus pimensis TaxID=309888 RepID=UPI0004831C1D|nr:hypothetical protein [Deinococcus pimensis]
MRAQHVVIEPRTARALRGSTVRALALIALGSSAGATSPLDAHDVRDALASGRALAAALRGYPVREYLLYSVPDAFTVKRGEAAVEAVQIGTPFERARWSAYFLALQGKAFSERDLSTRDDQLEFIVYAHSRGPEDQTFMSRFTTASLTFEGGREVHAASVARSPASLDHYRDAQGRVEFRWVGTVTYRFDLRGRHAADVATLRFTDADGHTFRLPFDRQRYR